MKSTPKNDAHIWNFLLSIFSRNQVNQVNHQMHIYYISRNYLELGRILESKHCLKNLASRSEVNPPKRRTHLKKNSRFSPETKYWVKFALGSEVHPLKWCTHWKFFLLMHILKEFGLNNVMLVTQTNCQWKRTLFFFFWKGLCIVWNGEGGNSLYKLSKPKLNQTNI